MVKYLRLLKSERVYKIIWAIQTGNHNYNEISRVSGIEPRNLGKTLNRLYIDKTNILGVLSFLDRKEINKNNVQYNINHSEMLDFIIRYILEVPYILDKGLDKNILKEFMDNFFLIGKYYSVYEFFNFFILKCSRKFTFYMKPIKKKIQKQWLDDNNKPLDHIPLEVITDIMRAKDILNKDYRLQIKNIYQKYKNEEIFYLACSSYIEEKIIKS